MRKWSSIAVAVATASMAVGAGSAFATDGLRITQANRVAPQQLAVRPSPTAAVTSRQPTSGEIQVALRLGDAPLVAAIGANARRTGITWTAEQQRDYVAGLQAKLDAVAGQARALGAREIGRTTLASSTLMVAVDASNREALASIAGVAAVDPIVNYELSLSNTVPYIGAKAAQDLGFDGTGVTVAVIDSGIDYTHKHMGGAGTLAAYQAAYGTSNADPKNQTRDGLFPTAKVVEGFDFVGEAWPSGPLAPDPDPIDFQGHGSSVADIVAGRSLDGTKKGTAPGAKLVAAKACSAVSTSCSGVAILQALDYVLDPNRDGDVSDAVDVVNLSLGASYGQRENATTVATGNVSRFGVVVVASAGNSADRPFITGSPSSQPDVIGVAQTSVPTATAIPLVVNSPASIAGSYTNTNTVDWAPIVGTITGDLVNAGRACPAGSGAGVPPTGDPLPAGLAGKIALVDRGVCSISLKVDYVGRAGAIAVVLANNVAGDAPSFSFGGGSVLPPTLVVTQAIGNTLRTALGTATVNVTLSTASAISLAGSLASTSSRGPQFNSIAIKPEIGAPGASVAMRVGTGDGTAVFGGTSGAAPMVAGSAAILLQRYPTATPTEIKARLMNNTEREIFTSQATQPGVLAPISRIGSGEVRVDRALAATALMYDAGNPQGVGLSYGVTRSIVGQNRMTRRVLVRNFEPVARTFNVATSFRYATDQASGAIAFSAPPTVTVPANGSTTFTLVMTINAANLPAWTLNGGPNGGNGVLLNGPEYDGYLALTPVGGGAAITLPWHVLPHRAANVTPATTAFSLGGAASANLGLTNPSGAQTGVSEVFALTGVSPQGVQANPPGSSAVAVDLRAAGVRLVNVGASLGVQFAISTWNWRAHPAYPAEFDVYIDTNNDGTYDWVLFNIENGVNLATGAGFATTGQTLVAALNLATGTAFLEFFADADFVSGNVIYTATLSRLGITPGTRFTFEVRAFDNYFGGPVRDLIAPATVQLDQLRFGATAGSTSVPANGAGSLTITRNAAGDALSPGQLGILLMHRDGRFGREADAITVTP